jgi:hypothetical protein
VEYAALDDRFALRDGAGRVHVEGFVYPVVA